ncbi:ASCH domain-containing protein [Massilia endophytica]|uniref:hypothetical protein n=1 Tax=Massilia endophytica TaxID=2899220 RepID=UPI001E3F76A3|nr:hypothetical protein [Massilia endophytica]UGQ44934.1 hypothetical protein LSQ66_14120 [Massilia endophytica]
MKERPILFSAPMVRAILDGSKTQTRRVVKRSSRFPFDFVGGNGQINDPTCWGFECAETAQWWVLQTDGDESLRQIPCPYGQPGDRLWVRETYADIGPRLTYRADTDDGAHCVVQRWTPAIHMFRADSRILLEIVSVRVERLQDISQDDARAEGITDGDCVNCGEPEAKCACSFPMPDYRDAYCNLWETINGAGAWDANPWVWVVEFKRASAGKE